MYHHPKELLVLSNTIYMSNMILLCRACVTVICHVSVRSAVPYAYLNQFVHTHTMYPE